MGYFNFYIIRKIINSFFRYIRKNKKFIIIFIIFVCILFIREKCFAVTNSIYDVEQDIINLQQQNTDEFIYHCMSPYFGNTQYWQQELKPIFDTLKGGQYDFYIGKTKTTANDVQYFVRYYYLQDATLSIGTYTSDLVGYQYQGVDIRYGTLPVNGYNVTFYPSTNSGSVVATAPQPSFSRPYVMLYVKTQLYYDFINLVYNGGSYDNLLNSINTSLNNIETVDADILTALNALSQSLVSIQNNTSTNYSQQIGQISNKISDLLNDNDTIISQNESMIAQQEQINENLENVNDSVQELKDTITDDTVESTASDLPSTDVSDPTQSGIDNIFQSIYNAFCVGEAQDIVFPIPFTNKNITLSPYYVRDMLVNNGASWVYTLIQAFWGYLIGRFIVKDILNKITKIKSGNIEEIQNDNIKGEML